MTDKERSKPGQYILKRIGQTILIWFLIVVVNFFIFRIMPGDPRGSLISDHMPLEVRQAIYLEVTLENRFHILGKMYCLRFLTIDFGTRYG